MKKKADITPAQRKALVKILGKDVVLDILSGMVEFVTKVISAITHRLTADVDETTRIEIQARICELDCNQNFISSTQFPVVPNGYKGKRKIVLCRFNTGRTSKEVIEAMYRAGYRPATIWELLAVARKILDLRGEFSIVALGSVCLAGGYRQVPVLGYMYNSLRCLCLGHFEVPGRYWDISHLFAAVRK